MKHGCRIRRTKYCKCRTTMACHSGEACLPAGREESAFTSIIADASCVSMIVVIVLSIYNKAQPNNPTACHPDEGRVHLRFNHCTDTSCVSMTVVLACTVVMVLSILYQSPTVLPLLVIPTKLACRQAGRNPSSL